MYHIYFYVTFSNKLQTFNLTGGFCLSVLRFRDLIGSYYPLPLRANTGRFTPLRKKKIPSLDTRLAPNDTQNYSINKKTMNVSELILGTIWSGRVCSSAQLHICVCRHHEASGENEMCRIYINTSSCHHLTAPRLHYRLCI